jgi:Fe-S-cluster-containing dehydrogenase component
MSFSFACTQDVRNVYGRIDNQLPFLRFGYRSVATMDKCHFCVLRIEENSSSGFWLTDPRVVRVGSWSESDIAMCDVPELLMIREALLAFRILRF